MKSARVQKKSGTVQDRALNALLADTVMLSNAAAEGKLEMRADASKHQGAYAEIVRGMNATLDAVIGPLKIAAGYVDQISKGEIPAKITDNYKGDFNAIKSSLNSCVDGLGGLVEANKVLRRMAANDYTTKVEGSYQGIFAELAKATNLTADRVKHVVQVVENLGKGDYKKDQLDLEKLGKRSENDIVLPALTQAMSSIDALQKEMLRMSDFAKSGQLSERANPDQFKGSYAEIVKGVNTTLDAILLPIGEGNRILALIRGGNLRERVEIACKGDHAKMKDAVNGVHAWLTELTAYATKIANGDMSATMSKASDADQIHEWLVLMKNNINALIADVIMLSKTAVEGKLAARADASKHSGEYRKFVEGFNGTLDAVIGPLNMAAKYVDDISKGKVPVKITDAYNGDFNTLKNNLNACIDGLGGLVEVNEVLQLMAANDYTSRVQGSYQGVFAEVGKATNKTADTLRPSMEMLGQNVQALSSAAEELTATSQQMSANAEETSAQTKVVSAATLSVSQNLQTVATGAEEMGASIKEIAKNATEAAKVATSAVKVAETANATVSKLGDSSTEIGQVIKVITSIAQQTNLLALNATIEAARAGEAGKGFAVVANEVKELAKETAKATEDISRKIEAIQTDTKAAVDAIGTISEVINQINGISSTIASAVEEQNATTNEMSRNVSEAARGGGEITSNIAGVAQAAESTSRGAGDTQKAAQDLVETATQLRRLVEQFTIKASENVGGHAAAQSRVAHAGS